VRGTFGMGRLVCGNGKWGRTWLTLLKYVIYNQISGFKKENFILLSSPTADNFRLIQKRRRQGVQAGFEKHLSALGRACVNQTAITGVVLPRLFKI